MNAPHIEIKNVKHTAWASEETHCYQATLFVDGEKWGTVSNAGHGGPDDFHGIADRSYADIAALNARIAETVPPYEFDGKSLPYDLEMICGDLVNEWLRNREFDRAMKSKILFTKPNTDGVWQVPVKKPNPFWMVLDSMKAKYPTYTYLADLPVEQARAIYFA